MLVCTEHLARTFLLPSDIMEDTIMWKDKSSIVLKQSQRPSLENTRIHKPRNGWIHSCKPSSFNVLTSQKVPSPTTANTWSWGSSFQHKKFVVHSQPPYSGLLLKKSVLFPPSSSWYLELVFCTIQKSYLDCEELSGKCPRWAKIFPSLLGSFQLPIQNIPWSGNMKLEEKTLQRWLNWYVWIWWKLGWPCCPHMN